MRASFGRAFGLVAACAVWLAAGCGAPAEVGRATAPAVTFQSTFAREYARLHGATDAGILSAVAATQAEIAAALRAGYTGDVLLLPSTLPVGFALAAPFRGTGSGGPLPNPHAWGSGYAVTYTDGRGRLTLMVNPDEPVEGGAWERTTLTLGGAALVVQERGGLVLVSTTSAAPLGAEPPTTSAAPLGAGLPTTSEAPLGA
ncbi:MAG TPA: hypothetical protein VFD74_09740, partial [Thermoleophilia bacterium]|nr:hypothetical protein [Thermoleophilia bacterium]